MPRQLSVSESVSILQNKRDIKFRGNTIKILTGRIQRKMNDIGIKSWGRLDFLRRKGYSIEYVDKF